MFEQFNIGDCSVDITTGYGLDDRMIGLRFPAGAVNFSLWHHIQTALEPTQPPMQG